LKASALPSLKNRVASAAAGAVSRQS